MRFRSFQRGTVGLCKSKCCKVAEHQILRMILSYRTETPVWCVVGWAWQSFSLNLQLWQLITFHLFYKQRPTTIPLWKDIILFKIILSTHKIGSILKIGFALSKWPHLHRTYVVGGCLFNLGPVPLLVTLLILDLAIPFIFQNIVDYF